MFRCGGTTRSIEFRSPRCSPPCFLRHGSFMLCVKIPESSWIVITCNSNSWIILLCSCGREMEEFVPFDSMEIFWKYCRNMLENPIPIYSFGQCHSVEVWTYFGNITSILLVSYTLLCTPSGLFRPIYNACMRSNRKHWRRHWLPQYGSCMISN